MKKLILLFTFLFTISSSFLSCKSNVEATDEVLETDEVVDEGYEGEVAANGFGEYDLDEDGLLNTDEFDDAYEEDWTKWDADGDKYLNDAEFYKTTYGWVDADDDGVIDEEEWKDGFDNLYGDYNGVEYFDLHDLNDNELLDENEWVEGWGNSNWFNDYDQNEDKLLDLNEWNEGLFENWDESDDGFWDENEYNSYSGYYETW